VYIYSQIFDYVHTHAYIYAYIHTYIYIRQIWVPHNLYWNVLTHTSIFFTAARSSNGIAPFETRRTLSRRNRTPFRRRCCGAARSALLSVCAIFTNGTIIIGLISLIPLKRIERIYIYIYIYTLSAKKPCIYICIGVCTYIRCLSLSIIKLFRGFWNTHLICTKRCFENSSLKSFVPLSFVIS